MTQVLTIIFTLMATSLMAQSVSDQYISIQRFDTHSGLSGNKVTHINQTEDGFLWVATHNGLNRYDGERFEWFQQNSQIKTSLPSNQVSTFHVDGRDMWLSLNEMGLARRSLATGQFTTFPVDESGRSDAVMSDLIFAIQHDAQGRLWFFQFEQGISVFDPKTQQFEHMTKASHPWLTSLRFFDAELDNEGHMWVATLDGQVMVINTETRTGQAHPVELTDGLPNSGRVYDLTLGDDGHMYAGTADGLQRFNQESSAWQLVINQQHLAMVLGEAAAIRHVLADQGLLWLSTRKGLLLFNQQQLTRLKFMEHGQVLEGIENIRSVFIDQEQTVWVATDQAGMLRLSSEWRHLKIKNPPDIRQLSQVKTTAALGHDLILAVDEGAQTLWMGQYQRGQLRTLRVFDASHGVPNQVNQIYQDQRFRLWLTSANGLFVLDQTTQQFKPVENPLGLSGINHVFEVRGQIWLTVYGDNAWYRVDEGEQNVMVKVTDSQPLNTVTQGIAQGLDGRLWHYGNQGILALDNNTGETEVLLATEVGFSDMWLDPYQGVVAVVGHGQMAWYQFESGQLLPQSDADINQAMADVYVTSITRDDANRWWFGSENGWYRWSESELRHWDVSQGMPSNDVLDVATLHDGTVMAYTPTGWVQTQAAQNTELPSPKLHIESLMVNDATTDASQTVELPYRYGVVQVNLWLQSLKNAADKVYQYRVGTDQEWQSTTSSQLSFYQLSPGHYPVQVRGRVGQGPWSAPVALTLAVEKPFWDSSHAYLLYAALVVFLAALVTWILRQRWRYQSQIESAGEQLAFAQNQLSVNHALSDTLDMEKLFDAVKQHMVSRIGDCQIEVAYWNSDTQFESYSHQAISKQEKLALGNQAFELFKSEQAMALKPHPQGHEMLVGFHLSPSRLGVLQLISQKPFDQRQQLQAQAFASQLAMSIEHVRLFSETQQLAKQAQSANQAKSDFLAQVSHEIRTPMNGVLGMNQLLANSALNTEQKQYVDAITESGQHLLHIINDLLDYSKIEAGQLELEQRAFSLQDWVDELVVLFSHQAKQKGLLFLIDVDPALVAYRIGDPIRLKQIAMNLLSNAFKFTDQGQITLRLKPGHQAERLLMAVEDTGAGIPPEQLDDIFNPFTQADSSITRKYGGTGLGLGIVKQLSELMSGFVSINSELGQGTQINCSVQLPLDHDHSAQGMTTVAKVLLVCDEERVQDLLGQQLTWLGFQLAKNGDHDAIVVAKTDPSQADLNDWILQEESDQPMYWLILNGADQVPDDVSSDHLRHFPPTCSDLRAWFSESGQVPVVVAATSADSLRILVLEDHPCNQSVLEAGLAQMGHQAEVFDNVDDALQALESGCVFDALLVDYHLPDSDGFAFIEQARSYLPDATFIVVSADVSDQFYSLCQQHQIDDVMAKPLDLELLEQWLIESSS